MLGRGKTCRTTVLTKGGPQLWLKSRTGNATRLNEKVYYTEEEFEHLIVALALQCRGRVRPILKALQARWSENVRAALFLLVDSAWLREMLDHVFTNEGGLVQETLRDLKHRAAQRGEWVLCVYLWRLVCLYF